MKKRFVNLFVQLLLLLSLVSCGANLPEGSSGFCSEVGSVQEVDGILEICLQRDDISAWFSNGPEIDRLEAVGRSLARIAASDDAKWEAFISDLNVKDDNDLELAWDNLTATDNLANSVSKSANDERRWDPLQIAIGKYQSAEEDWLQEAKEWTDLSLESIKSGRLVSYEERQAATKSMNRALARMQSIFDYEVTPNLKPFISTMLKKIGIVEEMDAARLTLRYIKGKE